MELASSTRSSPHNATHERLYDGITITEIKRRARENTTDAFSGTSRGLLITAARLYAIKSQDLEKKGELKSALETLVRSATLTNMYVASTNLDGEAGEDSVQAEFMAFMEEHGFNIVNRFNALEKRFMDEPTASSSSNHDDPRSGGDRLVYSLDWPQDAGPSVAGSTRSSISSAPQAPVRLRHKRHNLSGTGDSPAAMRPLSAAPPPRDYHKRLSTSASPSLRNMALTPTSVPSPYDVQVAISGFKHTSTARQPPESINSPTTASTQLASISEIEREIETDNLLLDRQLVELRKCNDKFIAYCQQLGTGIDVMQASIRLLKPSGASNSGKSRRINIPASPRYSPGHVSSRDIRTPAAPTIDREIGDFLQSLERLQAAMDTRATWLADEISAQEGVVCTICLEKRPEDDLLHVDNCKHEFCLECFKAYVVSKIQEQQYPILCPTCVADRVEGEPQRISLDLAKRSGLARQHIIRFRDLTIRATYVLLECRRCRQSTYMDKDLYSEVVRIQCVGSGCGYVWCKQCDQEIRKDVLHSCDGSNEFVSLMEAKGWRRCPTCQTPIEMESGCYHVICAAPGCNTHFCYACGFKIGRASLRIQSLVEAHYRTCTLFIVPPDAF